MRTAGDPLAVRESIQGEVRGLVPSWRAFQFRTLAVGDSVNLEADMIARYVERLVRTAAPSR